MVHETSLNIVNTTDKFIDELYEMSQGFFSETVVEYAKYCLLDYLGVTLTGARMLEEKGNKLLNLLGSSQGDITVIGFNSKSTIFNAVLINGLSSHVAELDDGERFAMMHPGSPIISALLAVAEEKKLSGDKLIKGIIVGYEAAIRVARTLQPAIKDRGYHATGVCGALGVAIAVASALGFSKDQMKSALSAAATGAAGILEVIEDGSDLKPYNSANAALTGLTAAFLGQAGFQGPNDVLTGKRGFMPVLSSQYDISKLERKPGDYHRIENRYVKPFAACRHCHPAIEAALNILNKSEIDPHAIKSIKVSTYYWAVGGHDHTEIHGISSAKMSTPYSVAIALIFGKAGLNEFSLSIINNKDVKSLTQKVKVYSDDEFTGMFPEKRGAIVEIELNDGLSFSNRVDIPKGEPENPLTNEELKEKFFELALYGGKSKNEADDIFEYVMSIDRNIENLFKHLK